MPYLSDTLTSFKIVFVISNNIEHTKKYSKKALISYAKIHVFLSKNMFLAYNVFWSSLERKVLLERI